MLPNASCFFFGSVETVQNMGGKLPKKQRRPEARYLKKILTQSDEQSHHSLEIHGVSRELVSRLPVLHMGVSKNRDTPKWMVYNGKPY